MRACGGARDPQERDSESSLGVTPSDHGNPLYRSLRKKRAKKEGERERKEERREGERERKNQIHTRSSFRMRLIEVRLTYHLH